MAQWSLLLRMEQGIAGLLLPLDLFIEPAARPLVKNLFRRQDQQMTREGDSVHIEKLIQLSLLLINVVDYLTPSPHVRFAPHILLNIRYLHINVMVQRIRNLLPIPPYQLARLKQPVDRIQD